MIESGEVPVGVSEVDRRASSRRRSSLLGLVVASILALTACGPTTLWTWGGNSSGAVGDGTVYDQRSPVQIGTDTNWTTVTAGGSHTVAIRSDGTLWAWGSNFYGQLGDGTTTNRFVPTQIGTDTNWKAVDAGGSHTVAIRKDGTLWAWGGNLAGQVGDGTTADRWVPTQIGSSTDWKAVSAGSHTVAIRTDGTLWTWGQRLECLVASVDGCTTDPYHLVPTQIGAATNWATVSAGALHAVAIRADGTLWTWGRKPECINWPNYCDDGAGYLVPTQIGSATDWATVSAGTFHTLGTRTDGTLWGWGDNLYRQIGIGVGDYPFVSPVPISADTNWKTVSAGYVHSTAIRTDGTLWVWGGNNRGQQGIGEELSSAPSPYQVGTDTNWATVSAGSWHTAATRTAPSAP